MIGVSAVGNATLIAYDNKPILATDPWFGDEYPAYFGSWGLSHTFPPQCKLDVLAAKYIWFSHGHPDHLNERSLEDLRGKKILLPDHVGGRIAHDLRGSGFDVTVLADRRWIDLSPRVRVFCITTFIQDAVLLVEVNGRLFVNLNDAGTIDSILLIRKIVRGYKDSYMMSLSGYGDADMINIFNEGGEFITPAAAGKSAVGRGLSQKARSLGIRNVIPFSSFHTYQRTDSAWAQQYTTPIGEYENGFDHENVGFVPAFSFVDCETGGVESLGSAPREIALISPEACGDYWSDELSSEDLKKAEDYFSRKELVRSGLSFINLRVGNKDNFIKLNGAPERGITFEVPRNSLMSAIGYRAFDDLLIGNFMKTTLHGLDSLYDQDFNFAVTKFGDNGCAESRAAIAAYINEYRRRAGADWYYRRVYERLMTKMATLVTENLPRSSPVRRLARRVHRMLQ